MIVMACYGLLWLVMACYGWLWLVVACYGLLWLVMGLLWALEQTIKPKWIYKGNNGDYLIPWLDKYTKQTFYRFYHLFSFDEINKFVNDLKNVNICNIVFEKDNWCVELQSL